MDKKDRRFMLRAIELAKRADGKTFPNPLVGAVIVKKGGIIGEGYHKKAGMEHAEVAALKKAKKNARDAVLYVNLEPCAHHGKTPPCVRAIKKSGIKKVYVAMKDPNPLVNGKGLNFLTKGRIDTKLGICRREAKELNLSYIKRLEKEDVHRDR